MSVSLVLYLRLHMFLCCAVAGLLPEFCRFKLLFLSQSNTINAVVTITVVKGFQSLIADPGLLINKV